MNKKPIFLLILILFCGLLPLSISAQLKLAENTDVRKVASNGEPTTDKEIADLEKRLFELKEKKIREYEAEIQRAKAEIEKLRGAALSTTSQTIVETTVSETENTVLPKSVPAVASVPQNDAAKDEVNSKCQLVGLNPQNSSALDINICKIAKDTIRNVDSNKNVITLNDSRLQLITIFALKLEDTITARNKTKESNESVEKSLFFDSERKRTDKQVGASSESPGTTSLVVKGGAPAIIGWAVENGSATSSIDGNTVTVRVNPFNLSRALFSKADLLSIRKVDPADTFLDKFVKKLNFGFSFDTTRGQETPTFIVSKQQLSSWSVRYEFINHRNPLSKRYKADRENFFAGAIPNIKTILDNEDSIAPRPTAANREFKFSNPLLQTWLKSTNDEIGKISIALDPAVRVELIRNVIEKQLESLPVNELTADTDFVGGLNGFVASSENILKDRKDFLDKVNRGAILTLEYTNNREVDAPDTSNVRFIWEQGFMKKMDFTLNAEMTFFNKKPATMDVKRVKDFNIAMQFDAPLLDILSFGKSVFSGAIRYTRQQGDVVLPNGVVADGTKGDILFGQAKLTIPFFDTGIKLPLSLTFGNRSEFIKEKFVRANFGLTFDLDQIFRPFSIFK